MLCRISKENSKILDKIITNYSPKNIIINITEEIILFLKLENNILYSKLKLQNDFFDKLLIKENRNICIPKTNFYFPEMEFLEIEANSYEIIFFWKLKTHERKKTFCIIEREPFKIEFEMSRSFKLDSFLLQEIIKHLCFTEIGISFNEFITFYSIESHMNSFVQIKNESEFYDLSISVLKRSLKNAVDKIISHCDFFIDEENCKMCVYYENENICFTHLMPIFIEKKKEIVDSLRTPLTE
ncbi:hypothetical protein TUBRATIS_23510 [Tubulinosema ratisbonensis]|uniref:Uncharacterized protein n=1 Tax=Tubulinosema ratisbonensis TaxID=291195 RepID=A0A437AJ53_9MICR|nr:hypothetical protein TUBRATIS_23510 [Tubulinosema ratisbonensis]